MRSFALVLLGLVACGGAPKATPATPSNAEAGSAAAPTETAAPPVDPKAVCANRPDDYGPIVLTEQAAAARHGVGATAFAAAPSSKDQPIEVCGVAASQDWLVATTCADGSHAFATPMAAAQSRAGNVGGGGRCGSIVDHYVAKCPEATYDVYVDMYMCGPTESF